MTTPRILQFTNSADKAILTQLAIPVDTDNPAHVKALATLTLAAREHKCAGMTANQIGHPIAAFVVVDNTVDPPLHRLFINPKVTPRMSDGIVSDKEGCLSIDEGKKLTKVRRYKRVAITSDNQEPMEFKGFLARVVQHENDHLQGKMV